MPYKICVDCGKEFFTWITINGKRKRLCGSRSHCPKCVPPGVNPNKLTTDNRVCGLCGKEFVYTRKQTKYRPKANTCSTCVRKIRKLRLKVKSIQYKGGKCQQCGYSKSKAALTFHHTDKTNKKFTLAKVYETSWINIKRELDKCTLLCANCHFELHELEKLRSDDALMKIRKMLHVS